MGWRSPEKAKIAIPTPLESAANAIMITNEQGKIIWINPAFTQTTGYSSAEVAGRNPRFLLTPEAASTYVT